MKVIILVLATKNYPYNFLANCIKETWGSTLYSNDIEIYYYYAGSDKLYVENNEIFCPSKEGYMDIGYKTITTFDWLLKNKEFDYIFRTNISSYVNQEKLIEFLQDKPRDNFYCGQIVTYGFDWSIKFCSGCGYFLSRDLVELVINNQKNWNHLLVDDVALGKLLTDLSIPMSIEWKRFDIDNYNENDEIDLTHYHYRCKCIDRNDDVKIMKKIHRMLNKK